ncbi:transposase [Streptococcus respiraculi]|uniref:transposase n=1 Tax=Streptococcus respiraculi TaxID=2021971 RepID=UPI000E76692F|nr:transposase [Streptococcus respiraculi]
MSKRSPKSVEEKLEIVCLLLNQEQSLTQLSKQYQVDNQTIQFYNTQRYQAKLNNLTPLEFRNQVA